MRKLVSFLLICLIGVSLSGCMPGDTPEKFARDVSIMTSPDAQKSVIKVYQNFLTQAVLNKIMNYDAGIVEGREGYFVDTFGEYCVDDSGQKCFVLYGYRNATKGASNFLLTRVYYTRDEITDYDVTFYYPYDGQ